MLKGQDSEQKALLMKCSLHPRSEFMDFFNALQIF